MTGRLRLTVLSPAGMVLDRDGLAWVRLRLADGGLLTVYPRHAPLLAQTAAGVIRYQEHGAVRNISVGGGLFSIRENRVSLLLAQAKEE